MSKFNHTPEPWDNDTVGIIKAGTEIHGIIVPIDIRALAEDNYQRAKACVNACAGMHNPEMVIRMMKGVKVASSEVTTKGAIVTFDFDQAVETINSLTKQRDELLAALELYMKRLNDGWLTNLAWREETHTIMQQAINNAKGGQQ